MGARSSGDITPLHALSRSVERIMDAAVEAALAVDERDRIVAWNGTAANLLGYPADKAMGTRIGQLLKPRDVFGNRLSSRSGPLYRMTLRGEPVSAFRLDVRDARGVYMRVDASVVVVVGPQPKQYNVIYLLRHAQTRWRSGEVYAASLHPSRQGELLHVETAERHAERLTPREIEVLQRIARGLTADEIAADLNISVYTARNHTQHILEKLGTSRQVEAVAIALRRHLI